MHSADDYGRYYTDLIGSFPERIRKRIEMGLELDPAFVEQLETLRARAVAPQALDLKTSQLVAFGILLNNLSAAAQNHALAALRAGATRAELHAVAEIAFLFRGLPAINHAGEAIANAVSAFAEPT